jgi:hypothetical protein
MAGEHSELSPSGADMWSTCPASIALSRPYGDESSPAADEGTAAHDFAHTCFRDGVPLSDFKGSVWTATQYPLEITQEVLNHLEPGLERFAELCGAASPDIELKVDLRAWIPDCWGTLDRGCATDSLIVIDDLKYGAGVPVGPVENKQLTLYALGYWQQVARFRTRATDFLFVIDQPRNSAGGGEWRTTLYDLLAAGEVLKKAAARTRDPDAPRVPSDKGCRFCKARKHGGCPDYDAWRMDVTGLAFDDLKGDSPVLEPPAGMTPERIAYVQRHARSFKGWVAEIEQRALVLAQEARLPGKKLVAGNGGDRAWADEQLAKEWLFSQMPPYEAEDRKTISVATAEKKLDRFTWRKMPAGLITRPAGKPQLVDASDPRPAITPIADMFDNLEEI